MVLMVIKLEFVAKLVCSRYSGWSYDIPALLMRMPTSKLVIVAPNLAIVASSRAVRSAAQVVTLILYVDSSSVARSSKRD